MRLPLAVAFLIHDALGCIGLGLHARDTYLGDGQSVTHYGVARRPSWDRALRARLLYSLLVAATVVWLGLIGVLFVNAATEYRRVQALILAAP
ncbi:hypothetical protein M446_4160 [Methylobacterium sp. 4-46]|uniref:hypothetical protein n=1 Tax=unclassified Methylobacterium TaxID=2615210 RepID=UPI000152C45E|nr:MULTISPECIES: hypothetical protein [Methylobacterium]ACA18517.1 hypothetical protein M446_4160 [Methylobacterium sp. 4-46]WFT77802.1 hypothetical protein QA634_21110 [Methylobacterium nodulans]